MKILVATYNPGKIREYTQFFKKKGIEVVTLEGLGISEKFEEDKESFEENARAKALFYHKLSGMATLSDDGGLEIDYLGGEPGVRSRRWLGHEASDEELIAHLKSKIKEIPKGKRQARFRAAACLVKSWDEIYAAENSIEGYVTGELHANYEKGLPYRALFIVSGFNKYYLDLSLEEGDRVNHRRKNVEELIKYLS